MRSLFEEEDLLGETEVFIPGSRRHWKEGESAAFVLTSGSRVASPRVLSPNGGWVVKIITTIHKVVKKVETIFQSSSTLVSLRKDN